MAGLKAVFLDRDGTLNKLALNPDNGIFESPHRPSEVAPVAGLQAGLQTLDRAGYKLFVISNQPSAAKGKCTMEDLQAVHAAVAALVAAAGVKIEQWNYCYHHPVGIVPGLSGPCDCRKPGTRNVLKMVQAHSIDLNASWFVGDQDADVACGKAAKLRTILIQNPRSASKRVKEIPDFNAADLIEAARIIISQGAQT